MPLGFSISGSHSVLCASAWAIVRAQIVAQGRAAFADEIEDAAARAHPLRPRRRIEARVDAEQPLEHRPRVGLGRLRRRLAAPRQAVRVGAAVAGVAVADDAGVLAAELDRTEPRLRADLAGRDLVHRDAVLDVGAGGLAAVDPGQEHGAGPGMVARAIAERVAVDVLEAGEHQHPILHRRQRLEDTRQLEAGAFGRRRPGFHRHAVRNVGEGEPERCRRLASRRRGQRRRHGVEGGQRHHRAQTAQDRPSGEVLAGDDHRPGSWVGVPRTARPDPASGGAGWRCAVRVSAGSAAGGGFGSARRIWNAGLLTICSTTLEKR
jgi:hypothetical protein